MKIWQYIQGNRKGTDAHLIEKEAMKDPFLSDALEGFENNSGNHQKEVAKLQRQIIKRQKQITATAAGKKPLNIKVWGIAAGVAIAIGLGTWFVLDIPQAPKKQVEKSAMQRSTIAQAPKAQPATPQVEKKVEEEKNIKADVEEKKEAIPLPPVAAAQPKVEAKQQQQIATATAVTDTQATSASSPKSVPELGMDAYNGYIARNLIRPTDDECRNVKGTVVVEFKVGQSGRPYNIRVTQGLCTSANKEAIRLVINGPRWKRGTESDDAKINVQF